MGAYPVQCLKIYNSSFFHSVSVRCQMLEYHSMYSTVCDDGFVPVPKILNSYTRKKK